MRLSQTREEEHNGLRRFSIEVHWEDADRPSQQIHIDVPPRTRLAARPTLSSFLPLAAVAAHVHGEARIAAEEPVDPAVLAGLADATSIFDAWSGTSRSPLRHVIPSSTEVIATPPAPHTALLVTGGADSTASLIDNHDHYGPDHPRRVRTGIVVYGLDESTDGDPDDPDAFLRSITDAFGIDLVAVRTNMRDLDPSVAFWWDHAQTATWTGVAHTFATDLTGIVIGSDDRFDDFGGGQMQGSHPLLDSSFSTTNLSVHHGVGRLTRLERLELLTSSPAGLANLQVCNRPRSTWAPLNCGTCEKCLRTMLALAGLGVIDAASGFPADRLTTDAVRSIRLGMARRGLRTHAYHRRNYLQMIPLLGTAGRDDLAVAVREMLRRNRLREIRSAGQGARELARRAIGTS